jgi:hypothetical protein
MSNDVNPEHYKQGEIECIDAISAATIQKSGIEAVCVANVIKYLWRYENKGGLTDVQKSRWYINKLIDAMQAQPVYAPLEVSKPPSGDMVDTLRWVAIDLGSDVLKLVADDLEVGRMLLLECSTAVPSPLSERIKEHLGV